MKRLDFPVVRRQLPNAKRLSMDDVAEFARAYPIVPLVGKLTWSHYKALIGGENEEIFLNQLLLNDGLAQFDPSVLR